MSEVQASAAQASAAQANINENIIIENDNATVIANANDYDTECQICCTTLNKSNYKPIKCPIFTCGYVACMTCVRTYLITNPLSEPHCMACKKQFNALFLVQNLTKTWVMDTYKKQITNVQVDIELSKLSESMNEAERRQKIIALNDEAEQIRAERSKIYDEYTKKINSVYIKINELNNKVAEKKTFVMPCSYNDCKGMLSTQYKCGMCQKYTCKDCHEPKEEEHKCNPDTVATAAAIKKDTRPCPSCNTRIYKIEGCDQMWCTNCKTPFSWDTGKIVPAGQRLHNPHAIDFLKSNGGGANMRAPGDLVCGGLISNTQYNNMAKKLFDGIYQMYIQKNASNYNGNEGLEIKLNEAIRKAMLEMHNYDVKDKTLKYMSCNLTHIYRVVEEVSHNKLRESRDVVQANQTFHEQRVKYILKQIDKDDFTKHITVVNKDKTKHTELAFIWELISTWGIEMFAMLYNISNSPSAENHIANLHVVLQKMDEFEKLRHYVNSQLAIVSVSHNCSVNTVLACRYEYGYNRLFINERYTNARMKREFLDGGTLGVSPQ
jgi:hypothetical protein